MLSVRFICVGKMRERFYLDAFEEYRKRLGAYCRLELLEPQEQRLPERPSAAEIGAALEKEAGEILKAIPQDAYVVALCVEGKELPSKPKLCFVVGGSYGLSETVKKRADLRLSMSKMTFPHHLARIMLAEQLYRGYKIREGSRYHK